MSTPTSMAERGGTAPTGKERYRRFRAPERDGQELIDPPWGDLPALVAANQDRAAGLLYDFQGVSLVELRARARRELAACVGGSPDQAETPLVVTGHQPELFHPGVWLKNFCAGQLARRIGGHSLNVVIDSDVCRSTSLRIPAGTVDSPRIETVAYDAPQNAQPYEERPIADAALFRSFAERVLRQGEGVLEDPLLRAMWPEAVGIASRGATLSAAIAGARHAVEVSWGNNAIETTIGRVCDCASFSRFAVDLLARLPEFHHAHNQSLADYRVAHRLRSPAQPLPDLHEREGWLEAPLWCWTTADTTRRAVYAKRSGHSLRLTDFASGPWTIDLRSDPGDQFKQLRNAQGLKIRSRALATTLFTRMLIADLFLHGIGGAKYDEVTDHLAERFYGFAPPPHATVSATLLLPIERDSVDPGVESRLATELRQLAFHPDKYLTEQPGAQAAIEDKKRWINTAKTRANAAERHRGITGANERLKPLAEPRRLELLREQQRVAAQLLAAKVLDSREYSFCLYPESWLRHRLLSMAANQPTA